MGVEERIYTSDNTYRYGFNGKEKDTDGEWGSSTHYDYGFRIYNPAIAKFLSVDPLTKSYPFYTPYQFAGNKPIQAIDLDGLEEFVKIYAYDVNGNVAHISIEFDESVSPLVRTAIHSIHKTIDGGVFRTSTENFIALNFDSRTLGYRNENNQNFVARKIDNVAWPIRNNTLFNEFISGKGSENTVIYGGKMIEELQELSGVRIAKEAAYLKWAKEDGKLSSGQKYTGHGHAMRALAGLRIWAQTWTTDQLRSHEDQAFWSTEHFLGSYTVNLFLLEDNETILFIVTDNKSLESLTAHVNDANSVDRIDGSGVEFSTTYQHYFWTEKIDESEFDEVLEEVQSEGN